MAQKPHTGRQGHREKAPFHTEVRREAAPNRMRRETKVSRGQSMPCQAATWQDPSCACTVRLIGGLCFVSGTLFRGPHLIYAPSP
jgi:hypothetical protein